MNIYFDGVVTLNIFYAAASKITEYMLQLCLKSINICFSGI